MTGRRARGGTYRIGEVARETGVTVEALRYYERLGILPRSPRTAGGERRFGPDAIARVRFVKQAQGLGLKLREIGDLVAGESGRSTERCRRVHDLLARHIDEIDRRTRDLSALRRVLDEYRERCEAALTRDDDPQCPMLDALDAGAEPAREAQEVPRR